MLQESEETIATTAAEDLGIVEKQKPKIITLTPRQQEALANLRQQVTFNEMRISQLIEQLNICKGQLQMFQGLHDTFLEFIATNNELSLNELLSSYQSNGKEFFLPKAE